ncbi:uncharacterized protein LOC116142663 [Pistacia vera]|uniref:uncharacterized protein LOC116142663 n=1 Tax=Pistacia vera TaxID=55513 RepID=UPI0012635F14|nr:uncharacterized protein LOC116142663 [Pistacia vera]
MLTLQELYSENPRVKEYKLCATLFGIRLREGLSPDDHVIKMINILGRLDAFGIVMSDSLKVNLILQCLPPSFKPFITNYSLNRIEYTLRELLNEILQFYNQGRKEKRQEEFLVASSSKTKKKEWKSKKGSKVGP